MHINYQNAQLVLTVGNDGHHPQIIHHLKRWRRFTSIQSLANTWYQLLEQRTQRKLIESQLELNQQLLKLIEARFRIGQVNASDVYRQRQLLAQTEGEAQRPQNQVPSGSRARGRPQSLHGRVAAESAMLPYRQGDAAPDSTQTVV